MNNFADRVKARRKELKLSQEGLAKRANISQSTVAQIEGSRNQGSKYLVQLAKALNVTPEWLDDGSGDVGEATEQAAPSASATDDENPGRLATAPAGWADLTQEERDAFQFLIKAVLDGIVALPNTAPRGSRNRDGAFGD